jgi:colicin import membrane protein
VTATDLHGSALLAQPRVALTPGVLLAVLLHALVFGGALLAPRYFDRTPTLRKPIIARLVALGKPRDAKLLPRKEAPAPPAPAARTSPAPVAPLAPPSVASKPGLAPPAPPKPRAPTRQELMDRALAKATGHAPPTESREKPDPDRPGQANGSAAGTAETAEAGERYFTEVHDAILANYVVPSVISERERLYLSATVVAWIKADGSLLRHQLQKASGNHFFDEALEIAIQKTRLPPPPPELARSLRDEGLALNFKP